MPSDLEPDRQFGLQKTNDGGIAVPILDESRQRVTEPAVGAHGLSSRPGLAGSSLARTASRVRVDLPLAALDALLIGCSYLVSLVVRFDGSVPPRYWTAAGAFLLTTLLVHLSVNRAFSLYGQVWRHASVAEARRVLLASAFSTAILAVATFFTHAMPRSVVIMGGGMALLSVGALRFHSRLFAFTREAHVLSPVRVVVVGARDAGAALVKDMLRAPGAGLTPVAVVDDDLGPRGLSLAGVPVIGGIDELASVVRRTGAAQVVLAFPSPPAELVQRVFDQAEMAGVPVKIVPGVRERVGGQTSMRDVRDLRIEDLLGRPPVQTDLAEVRRLLKGRRVLITGAGGSIGSEISRQVALCQPAQLVMLDHDETHLHDAAAMIEVPVVQFLADIRDQVALDEVMHRYEPEVVFHAAAHKHVPMLELHPCEAILTNVVGTHNVLRAAVEHGVERFVFISTDKAVEPSSIMGATKRLGEQLVASQAPPGAPYCAVRFGNVLGSRGSVIETFKRQIQAGGPVTITDPAMERFFITVQEAVQLVLQAAAFAVGGEVFMLDMGQPVRISDLAEKMIRLSGRTAGVDIAIRTIGRRDGEKLIEALIAPSEERHATRHAAIVAVSSASSEVPVDGEAVAMLAEVARRRASDEAAALLRGYATARSETHRSLAKVD